MRCTCCRHPRFGRRGLTPKALTQEEQYRQLLGLPFGRRLAATEVQQAFKRAAKTVHPDGGGNGAAFLELAAARDALIKHH
ncbi:curved DNA-binding protein CbpA [Bradyrhizobium elkanii]